MAQLVASMSVVVLGGVVEVVGSNLARGKIFTASIGSVDSLYPSVYIYIYIYIYINLAAILEICKLDSEDAIFQLANIGFWIQHTQITPIGIPKPFLNEMPIPS